MTRSLTSITNSCRLDWLGFGLVGWCFFVPPRICGKKIRSWIYLYRLFFLVLPLIFAIVQDDIGCGWVWKFGYLEVLYLDVPCFERSGAKWAKERPNVGSQIPFFGQSWVARTTRRQPMVVGRPVLHNETRERVRLRDLLRSHSWTKKNKVPPPVQHEVFLTILEGDIIFFLLQEMDVEIWLPRMAGQRHWRQIEKWKEFAKMVCIVFASLKLNSFIKSS